MTPKEKTLKVLAAMPADSSYDELEQEVKVVAALEEAELDIRSGKVVTHDEVKLRLARWISR